MREYKELEMETIVFENADVLTLSNPTSQTEEDLGDE